MAWPELKARLLSRIEAAAPDSQARTAFKRAAGRATVANTPRTSGGTRTCELLPGSSRLGPQVNGTAPKQVIQSATLTFLYPVSGKVSEQLDAIQGDASLARSILEDPRTYDFGNTGWQNCRVLGDSVSEDSGGLLLALSLELTYIGAH